MSVAGSDDQYPPVTALDLLACDDRQHVSYLKGQDLREKFAISSLAGVDALLEGQRDNLTQILSQVASQLPLGIDDLQVRLQGLAKTRDGSSDTASSQLQSESIVSTLPPIPVQDLEISSRHELMRDGGRDVCSTEAQSAILAAPMTGYEELLTWLSHEPDSETGAAEIKTMFLRQFVWRWNFRESQWVSRGLADTEGFCAVFESSKHKYRRMGAKEMTSKPSFDETIRWQWRQMSASQASESQTFPPIVTPSRHASRPTTSIHSCN